MKRSAAIATLALLTALIPSLAFAQNVTTGTWSIGPTDTAGKVRLELRWEDSDTDNYNAWYNVEDLGLRPGDLTLPSHAVHFAVRRDAGTIDFTGTLGDGVGGGHYTFSPSGAYRDAMAKRGYTIPSAREQLAAVTLDISLAYTDSIIGTGVKPESYGQLIAFRALGVTPQRIGELRRQFGSLDDRDVITFAALHIDSAYIRELASVGYTKLSAHELTELKALHVDADYIRRVQAHGFKHPTVEQLVQLKAMRIL